MSEGGPRRAPSCKACGRPIVWTYRGKNAGKRIGWTPVEPAEGMTDEQRSERVLFDAAVHRVHPCVDAIAAGSRTVIVVVVGEQLAGNSDDLAAAIVARLADVRAGG